MEKTLKFTDDGTTYTLAFTRETIAETEDMGFVLSEAYDKPMKSIILLWRGAFLEHHRTLDNAKKEALFEKIDKTELLGALVDLYSEPVKSLFDEEHSKNAVKWTVN